MCGEKMTGVEFVGAPLGSPPRARGEGDLCQLFGLAEGITPACAGRRV